MSQILTQEKKPNLEICEPCYPDFRFTCPHCQSFEVFVSWLKYDKEYVMKGFCTDCEKKWSQGSSK